MPEILDFLKQNDLEMTVELTRLESLLNERAKWGAYGNAIDYTQALMDLPKISSNHFDGQGEFIEIGRAEEVTPSQKKIILERAKILMPWSKGPFKLFGESIDGEWRSDLKWNRLKSHLPELVGKTILDIGCNNGYFMFKMAQDNPALVLGIDPVVKCQAQFKFLNHFAHQKNLLHELLGVDELDLFKETFDVIFSMGIIYHHRNPIHQLIQMRQALRPGGSLILETIGIPGKKSTCLFPEDRYAQMTNVWFLPTLPALINWVKRAKFIDVEIISQEWEGENEQRSTAWADKPSLGEFLDPGDKSKTIEGYPAPRRFSLICRKK